MTVADLQALLTAASRFAEAADISAAARSKLTLACESLAPFQAMDVSAFAGLLRQADEYQRTGVLSVAASSRKNRPPKLGAEDKALQVEHLANQLEQLYLVVHEDTVGYGAIDEIVDVVDKLGAPEVKKVAEKFGIKLPKKSTKKQVLEEIKRKLIEQKGSAQRIAPILSS